MRAMCYAIWATGCTKPLVQLEAIAAEREFLEVLLTVLSIDTGVHKCHEYNQWQRTSDNS